MPVPNTAHVEPATETPNPQPAPADMAERRLRSHPYLALKNVSCGWLDGVLVLRGCLPSYYLKQIAQEVPGGGPAHRQPDSGRDPRLPVTPGLRPDRDRQDGKQGPPSSGRFQRRRG
jgi:hypothetical protein